jgi:hypothetical protein
MALRHAGCTFSYQEKVAMSSRMYPTIPTGYGPHTQEAPNAITRRYEPLPAVPLKPRWPYVVAGIAVVAFLIAIGFFLTDAANDVLEDFSRYITSEPVVVPDID